MFENPVLTGALILVLAAILYAAGVYLYFYKRQHFVCPKCGYAFKPKLLRMIFSVNAVSGKIIRCPHCNQKEYMEPVDDSRRKGDRP